MLSAGIQGLIEALDQSQMGRTVKTSGFDGNVRFDAHREDRLIRELDVNLRTIGAIFVDVAAADYLTGEFFAFDHERLSRCNGSYESCKRANWDSPAPESS